MSETDAEFVERIKREWDGDNVPCVEDFDQLIALARRGAAMQTVGHLDGGKTAILKAAGLHQTSAKILEQAAEIERLRAALREIMGMDEVAIVEYKKGDGWLHQRVARAALGEKA